MTENEAIKELYTSIDLAKMCVQTPERKKEIEAYNTAIQALKDILPYRAIGTIEEFKALKEKSVAKKPSKDEFDRFTCSDCGWIVSTEEYGGRFLPHCENCGQAIDWSE